MAQVLSKPVDPIVEVEEDFEGQLERLQRKVCMAVLKDIHEGSKDEFGEQPWAGVWQMIEEDGWDGCEYHHAHLSWDEAVAEFKETHGLNLSDVNWDMVLTVIALRAIPEDEKNGWPRLEAVRERERQEERGRGGFFPDSPRPQAYGNITIDSVAYHTLNFSHLGGPTHIVEKETEKWLGVLVKGKIVREGYESPFADDE